MQCNITIFKFRSDVETRILSARPHMLFMSTRLGRRTALAANIKISSHLNVPCFLQTCSRKLSKEAPQQSRSDGGRRRSVAYSLKNKQSVDHSTSPSPVGRPNDTNTLTLHLSTRSSRERCKNQRARTRRPHERVLTETTESTDGASRRARRRTVDHHRTTQTTHAHSSAHSAATSETTCASRRVDATSKRTVRGPTLCDLHLRRE